MYRTIEKSSKNKKWQNNSASHPIFIMYHCWILHLSQIPHKHQVQRDITSKIVSCLDWPRVHFGVPMSAPKWVTFTILKKQSCWQQNNKIPYLVNFPISPSVQICRNTRYNKGRSSWSSLKHLDLTKFHTNGVIPHR